MSKSGELYMESLERGDFYPDDSDYGYEMWLEEQESGDHKTTKKVV